MKKIRYLLDFYALDTLSYLICIKQALHSLLESGFYQWTFSLLEEVRKSFGKRLAQENITTSYLLSTTNQFLRLLVDAIHLDKSSSSQKKGDANQKRFEDLKCKLFNV